MSSTNEQRTNPISDANMTDVELNKYQIGEDVIELREKKGLLRSAIPRINIYAAWIVLFLNVFLPGSGTIILSLFALFGVPTDLKKSNRFVAFGLNFITGIFQFITAVVVLGWIWSVYWGMFTVTESNTIRDLKKMMKKENKLLSKAEELEKMSPVKDCNEEDKEQ